MEMIQTFESTVLSRRTDHAGHFLVVPRRSLPAIHSDTTETDLFEQLSLSKIGPVRPSNLGLGLSVVLSPSIPNYERVEQLSAVVNGAKDLELLSSEDRDFGERIAFDRMVPLENSPLELESLSKVVMQATGAGMGAYAGFVLAGPTPLLFVTAPLGMILFGAAKGIADALEQGLRERLLEYLRRGENSDAPPESVIG